MTTAEQRAAEVLAKAVRDYLPNGGARQVGDELAAALARAGLLSDGSAPRLGKKEPEEVEPNGHRDDELPDAPARRR